MPDYQKNKSGMLSGTRHSGDIRKFRTTIIFKNFTMIMIFHWVTLL